MLPKSKMYKMCEGVAKRRLLFNIKNVKHAEKCDKNIEVDL